MAYLYRHIRLDINQPFYIGIGSDENFNRAQETKKRNKYWNSIVNVTPYEIEILLDGLSWEDACKKEIEFISIYGRKNNNTGILSNMTDGGEGTLGKQITEEFKNKLKERNKGNQYWKYKTNFKLSAEAKEKISKRFKGENHPRFGLKKSKEEINKMIASKGANSFYAFLNGKLIKEYTSQADCARELNINRSAINMCLKGKRQSTENYTFTYVKRVQ